MRHHLLTAAVIGAALLGPALAQTNTQALQPYVFPLTVGASPLQVLPQNDRRRSLEFCNPNASITCAVCPQVSRKSPNPVITCAVNGAGSVTLPPSWCWGKTVTVQGSVLSTAWNGVCSSSGNLTAFETE